MNIPKDLRYTSDHEWARVEGGTAVVGVTGFAVEQLGDITLVELPAAGTAVVAGKVVGTIESVKAVSDILCPLSGKVLEINADLEDAPEKVNEDCYGAGWMLKIAVENEAEVQGLMDAAAYEAHVAKH